LTILFLTILLYFLSVNWLRKARNINVDILFLGVMAVFQVFLVKSGIFISEAINRAFPFIPVDACFFTIPFAVGAMLVGIMINRNTAFIFSIFSSVLISFLFEARSTITLFSFLGSMTACYHIVHCRKRSAFFKAGFFLGLVNVVVIIALTLLAGEAAPMNTLIKMAMGFFGGVQAGVIVAGIAPLVEVIFKYTTDIKLLELANLNQPIFQRMIIESPGTYHHSIIVATMVEAAAETIGANSLLAKVSAYYHDIGKVKKPQYYIENQQNGENRHDKLSPRMSALVIISHIKDGCALAIQAKLGSEITNIIREHHGTSLVRYFYDKAKKDRDASIRALPESNFRYPGPKPQTREAGLVLLGDVIEASCRSLSNPTPSRIRNLVKERIERVFMEGQLDECELTLRDLNNISETFTRILNGIFHHRIDYSQPNIREFKAPPINAHEYIHRKPAEKGKA
jgi:putative nucleotidyltransferase with HDIG domain